MNTALLSALREIEVDKGIPFDTVQSVLEESLLAAYLNREGADEEAPQDVDGERARGERLPGAPRDDAREPVAAERPQEPGRPDEQRPQHRAI